MARSRSFEFALIVFVSLATAYEPAAAETVLLDFTSDQCPPCREMDPIVAQLARDGYAVRQIDVHRERALTQRFGVTVTPTFVVLVDDREWARLPSATSRAQLLEMMRKATELAHNAAPKASFVNDRFAMPPATAPGVAAPSLDEPREGRVVAIQNPFASRPPSHARGEAPPPPGPPQASPASVETLIAATVRLSITDPDGRSTGTGVIVDARNGMALVLTCGHLFRASNGAGAIQISQFTAAAGGAELRDSVAGELLEFDLDRDSALVRFAVNGPVTVAPVAPPGTVLEQGAAVTSVGCNHGVPPTPLATRITALNRYQGHPNVEAAGAPVEGRSGGGLFNAQGQVVGVCFAADPQGDEGLYASLESIQEKLRELDMAVVYEAPAGVRFAVPGSALAVAPAPQSPFAVRGQSPSPTDAAAPPGSLPAATGPEVAAPTPAAAVLATLAPSPTMTPDEQAALDEIARRGVGSEVICIIRPQSPDGRSDVIKISGASPAFVQALAAASSATVGGTAAETPAKAVALGGYLR